MCHGGAPKGGPKPRKGPRRVGPRKDEGPKISRFFSLSGSQFRSFCVSLGVFSWNFGVFEAPEPCAHLEFSGCRVKPRPDN